MARYGLLAGVSYCRTGHVCGLSVMSSNMTRLSSNVISKIPPFSMPGPYAVRLSRGDAGRAFWIHISVELGMR